jgi:NAD(P)H-flavin reductase
MSLEWYRGVVVDIIKETQNIRRFFIQIPDLEVFKFKAGQYVKLELPIESKKNYRQYSIAGAPQNTNIIELLIVLDPDGLATNYLFSKVSIGSELKVSKNMGNFILPEELSNDICFICTGVGLSPLRSMYLDIINRGLKDKNIYLLFGTRFMKDMIYLDEMDELCKLHNFNFIPVLSRENSSDWVGEKGYVHYIYKEIFADKRPADFFICGWKDMVQETRRNLLEMGYPRKVVHFERYN